MQLNCSGFALKAYGGSIRKETKVEAEIGMSMFVSMDFSRILYEMGTAVDLWLRH